MTFGFHRHPSCRVVAAFDGEFGKPSSGMGATGCNKTFSLNIGISPVVKNMLDVDEEYIKTIKFKYLNNKDIDILSACPPCTGFSRANPDNHVEDDERNNLVTRTALWVQVLRPRVLVMENARELLTGNFAHHFRDLRRDLERMGYDVCASTHMLDRFGLPQRRERALVVATDLTCGAKSLDALWEGWEVNPAATHVRRCIGHLRAIGAGEPDTEDPCHVAPGMEADSIARLRAIPPDGGSWLDLRDHPDGERLMTPAMKKYIAEKKFGSHPDVYGRMAWEAPAMTIKRECAHIGNGRYAHPEQDRLCTLREMAMLQGFPCTYRFGGNSLSNMYRHVGDAVPPLISWQLAQLVDWMFTGEKPDLSDCVLADTSLRRSDLRRIQKNPDLHPARPDRVPKQVELFV